MQHPTQSTLVTTQQPLIPTLIGDLAGQQQPLVDARTLHGFLQVGTRFDTWIERRISEFDFAETLDFTGTLKNERAEAGFFGVREKQVKHYHLSLDMAKELCMLERSAMGKQARRYFIECEKQLRSVQTPLVLEELLKARPLWADILRYKDLGLQTSEIALLVKRSTSTVTAHVRSMKACGLAVKSQPQPKPLQLKLV